MNTENTQVSVGLIADNLIVADKSVDKLNKLGYDPIERLVRLDAKIEAELYSLQYDDEGEPRRKFSGVTYAALIAIQAKIGADLMRYGYKRVAEAEEVRNVTPEPIRITLTHNKASNVYEQPNG